MCKQFCYILLGLDSTLHSFKLVKFRFFFFVTFIFKLQVWHLFELASSRWIWICNDILGVVFKIRKLVLATVTWHTSYEKFFIEKNAQLEIPIDVPDRFFKHPQLFIIEFIPFGWSRLYVYQSRPGLIILPVLKRRGLVTWTSKFVFKANMLA